MIPAPTPEVIAGWAGVAVSLALAYIPGLRRYLDTLTGDQKRAVMGALILLCAALALTYQCRAQTECLLASLEPWARAVLAALIGSQSAYVLAVKQRS